MRREREGEERRGKVKSGVRLKWSRNLVQLRDMPRIQFANIKEDQATHAQGQHQILFAHFHNLRSEEEKEEKSEKK